MSNLNNLIDKVILKDDINKRLCSSMLLSSFVSVLNSL